MDYEDSVKYPRIVAPVGRLALSPEQFANGKHTVMMEFEKDVLFTPIHGTRVRYPKGVHEVPAQFKDHWFLRANDARIYQKPIANKKSAPANVSEN